LLGERKSPGAGQLLLLHYRWNHPAVMLEKIEPVFFGAACA
jgi:hypothetical protein